MRRAERGEVMFAEQALRRLVHRGRVDWTSDPARPLALQRRPDSPVEDPVAVGAGKRAEPSVEIAWHFAGPEHAQVVCRRGGSAEHPGLLGTHGGRVEVRHLHQRVHPGVGPAGRSQVYRVVCHDGQCALEFTLHARGMRLPLPAEVGRAVVLQPERNACHPPLRAGWTSTARLPASVPRCLP